jgi:ethanolamine ammonia-lyase small subunit
LGFLQSYTSARIARGRAGHSLPTKELLQFQADHAQARDAVHSSLDIQNIQDRILHETIVLQSKATSRAQYLQRPDWGGNCLKPLNKR